jgi:hypothetical protein
VTHFVLMIGFSAAVGVVLGLILRPELRAGLRLAAMISGGMVAAALAISWLLYLLPW